MPTLGEQIMPVYHHYSMPNGETLWCLIAFNQDIIELEKFYV